MEEPILVYIVGTAGSGKTSLTHTFSEWLKTLGLDSVKVNLDPGAEELPYQPDIDIREWVSLEKVMSEHGLGPNGAQIACADMLSLHIGDVREALQGFRTSYVLIDTPGQIELFAFRKSSTVIMKSLDLGRSVVAFTFDPILCKSPSGLVSSLFLSATVLFRLGVPGINLLTKKDILTRPELDDILRWSSDPFALEGAVMDEMSGPQTQMNLEIAKGFINLDILPMIVPVSAHAREGMEDLYTFLQQVFTGGDDEMSD